MKLAISDDHKGLKGRGDPDSSAPHGSAAACTSPATCWPMPAARAGASSPPSSPPPSPGGRRQREGPVAQVADQLRPKVPKLAVLMDEAEHDVLAYMSFPREHRQKLHSTNPIERLHAEVKRRTNVVGIFPNEAAITRLVGAILLEQNDEWAVSRRYMTLESIAPLSDGVPITLPAVAA